jgi:hypothetical protein
MDESDPGRCPICFKKYPVDKLEQHVNACLVDSEKQTDPFSIVIAEEEEERRKRDEENERFVI